MIKFAQKRKIFIQNEYIQVFRNEKERFRQKISRKFICLFSQAEKELRLRSEAGLPQEYHKIFVK